MLIYVAIKSLYFKTILYSEMESLNRCGEIPPPSGLIKYDQLLIGNEYEFN